jgi:hypothetical protein
MIKQLYGSRVGLNPFFAQNLAEEFVLAITQAADRLNCGAVGGLALG